ncbi:hypothetical protein BH11BAC3_BH11BAC3_07320 [soil metagenome]
MIKLRKLLEDRFVADKEECLLMVFNSFCKIAQHI